MKKNLSHHLRPHFLGAALALTLPFAALADHGGPGSCGGPGLHGDGPGMMHGGHPGMMPPQLRGLNLTDAQRDKIFEIMHAQMPQMREQAKATAQAADALRKLAASPDYDEAKARAAADALGKASADMALARAATERKVYEVLTPEQRKQMAEMKPGEPPRRGDRRAPPESR